MSEEDQEVINSGQDAVASAIESVNDLAELKTYLIKSAEQLVRKVISEGTSLYNQVEELESLKKQEELKLPLIRSFVIGQEAKHLSLLYRDILFETIKADILLEEGNRNESSISAFIIEAKRTIDTAETDYAHRSSQDELLKISPKPLLKQDNPWPDYAKQLSTIDEQISTLCTSQMDLSLLSKSIGALDEEISNTTVQLRGIFEEIVANVSTLYRDPNTDFKTCLMLLREISDKLDRPNLINDLHQKIEHVIATGPAKMSPIVSVSGGELVQQDISPQYQMEQWYDVVILPRIEEANQKIDSISYNFKLALINVINRLELLQSNLQQDFNFSDHITPIDTLLSDVDEQRKDLNGILEEIDQITSQALTLESLLVKDLGFLSIGFQGSINRFKKEQNLVFDKLAHYWRMAKEKYFSIKSTVNEESNLGKIEKVIRYVQSMNIDRTNVHYNNFFNAKVSMVEAFWISRNLEEKRIAQVIDYWNKGYNASILLHGDYYSGKTSVGEWISQRYFRDKTYTLSPNKELVIAGQRIDLGNNLMAAINSFIERIQYAKPIILIDDLELWLDEDQPADRVIQELVQLINRYAKKICFVVTMGSWTYEKLRSKAAIDESFQAVIRMSPLTKDQIKEAILLRHGASQKSILNDIGEELSKAEFDRKISQIHHASAGNIGHALKLWLSAISLRDDEYVQIEDLVKYRFPDIMDKDNDVLLYTLLSYRRLSEEKLAAVLGPSYETKYQYSLERLIGYGVVKRSFNGILAINEKVAPEIKYLLEKHRYI